MKFSTFLALAVLCLVGTAHGADRFRQRSRSTTTTVCSGGVCTTTAHEDATTMARTGRLGHSGGAGGREGVGFSTTSPEDALNRCCYSGQYPVAEQSVVRGKNGWYAVRRYALMPPPQ